MLHIKRIKCLNLGHFIIFIDVKGVRITVSLLMKVGFCDRVHSFEIFRLFSFCFELYFHRKQSKCRVVMNFRLLDVGENNEKQC